MTNNIHRLRPDESAPMRLATLASILGALVPDDASVDDMLGTLQKVRRRGTNVVVHTDGDSLSRLADKLRTSADDVLVWLNNAPRQRGPLLEALKDPNHIGCLHMRTQLRSNSIAPTLLEAFFHARWYGWPGLVVRVGTTTWARCCCGEALASSLQSSTGWTGMDAINI